MKPKNVKEFKKLIERYESITLEEIEDQAELLVEFNATHIAHKLTGFGYSKSCTLCRKVKENCNLCVYAKDGIGHFNCLDDKSYDNIDRATSSEELKKAFKRRAIYLRKTYPQYLE